MLLEHTSQGHANRLVEVEVEVGQLLLSKGDIVVNGWKGNVGSVVVVADQSLLLLSMEGSFLIRLIKRTVVVNNNEIVDFTVLGDIGSVNGCCFCCFVVIICCYFVIVVFIILLVLFIFCYYYYY